MADTEARQDEAIPEAVARAHRFFREGRDHSSEWREPAVKWYDMEAGDQWDENDLSILKDQQRPAVTFNRILRTINAVTGTQIANRQETRYIPREKGDVQVNEVLTAAGDWVRDNCDAEDEESDAFRDLTICGMGWTETRLDYDHDPDGDIVVDRTDPLEMYWDPGATKRNLSDGLWVMHVRRMSVGEFEEAWPKADLDLAGAPWEGDTDDISQRVHVYPQDAYTEEQGPGRGGKRPTIRVAQLQWAERRDVYRVGKRAERLERDAFEKLQPKLDERGVGYIRQPAVKWKQAFVAGGAVLEESDCPFPYGPTLRCMTGQRDRNKGTWFGLVKAMVDPQRFGNKFFSLILDILGKGSKGGIMIEAGAVDDFRELESKWARPEAVIKLATGALSGGKIKEKPVVGLPPGLDRLMTFSMDAVHEVTGVSLEFQGLANRDQPGVLEAQRKQAGLTIVAGLFDAMRRYRKEQGRVMLHLIQEYISDGRMVRIIGQNGQEQYVPLARQSETAKYDVIVDEAPTSPNMKERVYGALVGIMPTLAKLGVPMPPELLDYAPIPSALASKWKELIQNAPGDPEEVRRMVQEGQKRIAQLGDENRKLKDKREETAAQVDLKQQEAEAARELKRQEVEGELELDRQKQNRELDLERDKANAEFELDEEKQQRQLDMARRKMEADIAAKRLDIQLKHQEETLGAELSPEAGPITEVLAQLTELMAEKPRRRIVIERGPDDLITSAEVIDERSIQ